MVLLCSSHSLTPGFLPSLLFFYSPSLRPFNIIRILTLTLNVVSVAFIIFMLIFIHLPIIIGYLILILLLIILAAIPINLISTISIAEFLEVLLPVYNPSSGSLRLLLLLLLPSLPPSLCNSPFEKRSAIIQHLGPQPLPQSSPQTLGSVLSKPIYRYSYNLYHRMMAKNIRSFCHMFRKTQCQFKNEFDQTAPTLFTTSRSRAVSFVFKGRRPHFLNFNMYASLQVDIGSWKRQWVNRPEKTLRKLPWRYTETASDPLS